MANGNELVKNAVVFSREAENLTQAGETRKWARFGAACISGIPWIGSLIAATAALSAENEQSTYNQLFKDWLAFHQGKLDEVQADIKEIATTIHDKDPISSGRINDDGYLKIVERGFRIWDFSLTTEKKAAVKKLLTNAALTNSSQDEQTNLFLDWLAKFNELHFKVIAILNTHPGTSRLGIWELLGRNAVRDDSADADLFRLMIRDLSMGGIIRQPRSTNALGQFKKNPPKRTGNQSTLKSAFDDKEVYELTPLGQVFVGFVLNEPSTAIT